MDPATGWRIFDSPYCRIVSKGHDDTLVAFSPINCPPGKFATTRAFATDPRNTVFLNCPANSWYLGGIPLLGHDLQSTADRLGKLLYELGLSNGHMIFWGGSMGGYGAVAMGALMNAEHVIATGAELELLVAGGNSDLILRKIQKLSHIQPPDVGSWVASSKGNYHLYCGEFAYHDLVSLSLVANCPRVSYRTLRDFGHPLPAHIERTYGLTQFINSHLSANASFPFAKDETGILWRYPDWWGELHAAANRISSTASTRLEHSLNDPSLPAELRGHMAHALSLHAFKGGNTATALRHAFTAVELTERKIGFHLFRLACAMKDDARQSEEWLAIAREIPRIEDPDRWEFGDHLIRMMHDGIKSSSGDKAATSFLLKQSKLSAKHAKRLDLLRSLSDLQDCPKQWKASFTSASMSAAIKLRLDRESMPVARRLLLCGFFVPHRSQDRIVSFSIGTGHASIHSQSSALASPGIAKIHPEIEWSASSRFRIEMDLPDKTFEPCVLRAKTAEGREFPCISLDPTS